MISVDRDFVRFDDKSVAVRQINSVQVIAFRPNGRGPLVTFALATSFGGLAVLGGERGPLMLLAILFGLLTVVAWKWRSALAWRLLLTTSSGEIQAAVSRDRAEILALRAEVEARVREIHQP